MQEQLDVSLGLVHGSAEKLQAAHVRGALNLDTTFATFLDDLLQLVLLHFRKNLLGRGLLGLLCVLVLFLLLRLLHVLRLLLGSRLLLRGGLWLGILLVLALLALFLGGCRLGSLGATSRGSTQELHVAEDGLELRLLEAEVKPAHKIAERLSEIGVEDQLQAVRKRATHANIGQGHVVADHVGVVQQVVVEDCHRLLHVLLRASRGFRNLREQAHDRQHPGHQRHLELVGAELDPGIDHAALQEVLAVEAHGPGDARDVARNGRGGKDAPFVGLQHWDFAALLSTTLDRLHIQAHVLGCDEGLVGFVIVRMGIQLHRHGALCCTRSQEWDELMGAKLEPW
mmetsp:Transcript_91441/g.232628  ORF Transcript_91441/g.232628 Transcript_91441/m.232628 type:complete len:341 (-) Transcript_91441:15-1037(-)